MDLEQCIREFREEIPAFREKTREFYGKEISSKDYKGFSGRFGSYSQRGGEAGMLRLRLGGGRMTKEQCGFIADCIERWEIDKVHLTTCQTVQLHNLKPEAIGAIMEEAIDHGIITWGGGGDFPRNVMVSPLSGAEPGEYFDVMPYAGAAADYMLTLINKIKMPRKLKVGFSNSPENQTHATFRDLGFAATERGTFDVYSAGGLGSNPKLGLCVAKDVEPEKILYYIKAMTELFMVYGNYENRGKARTRYMQDVLGAEGYVEAYRTKLSEVLDSGENLDIRIGNKTVTKAGDGSVVSGQRILSQKQDGLYSVAYHPIGGTIAPGKFREIYQVIAGMQDVELRLSPDQSLFVIHCTGEEANAVQKVTEDGAGSLFECSVACIGASICQIGVRDSQKLLERLVSEARTRGFDEGVLPRIHISGCPSSCGTHQIGVLGFHGGVKMIEKEARPAFTLHVNGCEEQGMERFGESWGVMLEADIPAFLMAVGDAVVEAGSVFDTWYPQHTEELRKIAERYLQ